MTNKLINTQKSPKAYWSLLKHFLNNKKNTLIPSVILRNRLMTDFKEKAELFHSFFAKQCSLIRSDSKLPASLMFYGDNRLSQSVSHIKMLVKLFKIRILTKLTVMIITVYA